MIYDYYEYFELVYKDNRFNKNEELIITFRVSTSTVLLPVVDLFYKESGSNLRIGGSILAYNNPLFDTTVIINNNPILSQKYGNYSDPDFFGVYNKIFGFIIYKNKNKIWRRIFQ